MDIVRIVPKVGLIALEACLEGPKGGGLVGACGRHGCCVAEKQAGSFGPADVVNDDGFALATSLENLGYRGAVLAITIAAVAGDVLCSPWAGEEVVAGTAVANSGGRARCGRHWGVYTVAVEMVMSLACEAGYLSLKGRNETAVARPPCRETIYHGAEQILFCDDIIDKPTF